MGDFLKYLKWTWRLYPGLDWHGHSLGKIPQRPEDLTRLQPQQLVPPPLHLGESAHSFRLGEPHLHTLVLLHHMMSFSGVDLDIDCTDRDIR